MIPLKENGSSAPARLFAATAGAGVVGTGINAGTGWSGADWVGAGWTGAVTAGSAEWTRFIVGGPSPCAGGEAIAERERSLGGSGEVSCALVGSEEAAVGKVGAGDGTCPLRSGRDEEVLGGLPSVGIVLIAWLSSSMKALIDEGLAAAFLASARVINWSSALCPERGPIMGGMGARTCCKIVSSCRSPW